MNETWYTPSDLAERLKVSEQTVRLWVRAGKVRATKFGRFWRISGTEMERVLTEGVPEEGEEGEEEGEEKGK